MAKRLINEEQGQMHVIRPGHISTADHFWNAFGNIGAENSAQWIVRFCQKRGNWNPFTDEEIEGFYRSSGLFLVNFSFGGLLSKYVFKEADGRYYLSHEFVCICLGSSPAESVFAQAALVDH